MSSLVGRTKDLLRPLKQKFDQVMPRRLRAAAPVAQAFLGGEYLSRYTLVNFPSLYSPSTARACVYDVALYDAVGTRIGARSLRIEPFGSLEVKPEELFDGPLPEQGTFTARIRAAQAFDFEYKHLGEVTSHFYALYQDLRGRSLALVHPQTLVDAASGSHMNWLSGYLLDAARIRRLTAVQINPTAQATQSSLFLFRAGAEHEPLTETGGVIAAMGARVTHWELAALGLDDGLFSIGARGLPTANAKPVLLTHFADGSFSGMHA
jgi:hypothetical protein